MQNQLARSTQHRLAIAFIVSLNLHILGLAFFKDFPLLAKADLKKPNKRTIEVSRADLEQFNKLRTVGIKNGKKGHDFSLPVAPPKPRKKVTSTRPKPRKINLPPKQQDSKSFDLNSLAAKPSDSKVIKRKKVSFSPDISRPKLRSQNQHKQIDLSAASNTHLKKQIYKDLKSMSLHSKSQLEVLNLTDFNIDFQSPEGVSKDLLNADELKYYSFRKRIYEGYLNSFLTVYHKLGLNTQTLKLRLPPQSEMLAAKITFDQKGHIKTIKMLDWSRYDLIQNLFEETLKGINSVPNPPSSILTQKGEFEIYYKFYLKGQG